MNDFSISTNDDYNDMLFMYLNRIETIKVKVVMNLKNGNTLVSFINLSKLVFITIHFWLVLKHLLHLDNDITNKIHFVTIQNV